LRPSTPSSVARFIHWLTAPSLTPRASAISVCFQPRSFSSKVRKRLPSRQSLAWLDNVFSIIEPIIPMSLGFYADISKLMKLTYMHVQGLYQRMQDLRHSARTVQYTHAVLHPALKQGVRWSMIPRNVCEGVDVPQVRREEMRPLNAEQARRLLRSASGERLEAFYVLAIHTGMRPGELLGLRWEDVTLNDEGGTLQLNQALSDGELATPKTKGSRIRLSAGSAKALKAHRGRQLEEMMHKSGLWQDYGLVFPSSVGTLLSHRNVVRSFKVLLKHADLPLSGRLYDLRHTCATSLLSRNVYPKYVQELLGHASISQTLDTYSHVIEGMDGGLTDAIDEALG
jgi:integrase